MLRLIPNALDCNVCFELSTLCPLSSHDTELSKWANQMFEVSECLPGFLGGEGAGGVISRRGRLMSRALVRVGATGGGGGGFPASAAPSLASFSFDPGGSAGAPGSAPGQLSVVASLTPWLSAFALETINKSNNETKRSWWTASWNTMLKHMLTNTTETKHNKKFQYGGQMIATRVVNVSSFHTENTAAVSHQTCTNNCLDNV